MSTRTIKVDYLARVEGEGALTMRWKGGALAEVSLRIFEPPRFFEALLVGREALEAPDITARICGICPVAYQMSACAAVEDAWGVEAHPSVAALRRLLYCGEWIESHGLHMVMLHAPDFLGAHDAIALAKAHGPRVVDGLAIKKAGNAIVALVGGREIHPINVRVGGFYRLPDRDALDALRAQVAACRPKALALVRWMASFDFPALERDYELVSLSPTPGGYPLMGGRVISSKGLDVAQSEWPAHFEEEHVARSNALHARIVGRGAYLCGPLARFHNGFGALPAGLQALAHEIGLTPPVTNPFRSLLVRGIELLYALDTSLAILDAYEPPPAPAVEVTPRAGEGFGATEAPRGLLFHRYVTDAEGRVLEADIVPPTSQNQLSIEGDLRALAPALRGLDDAAASRRAEFAIRNHDPCISCATHFLTLRREEAP